MVLPLPSARRYSLLKTQNNIIGRDAMLGVSGITVGDVGEINACDLNGRDAMLGVSGGYNACDLNTKKRQALR